MKGKRIKPLKCYKRRENDAKTLLRGNRVNDENLSRMKHIVTYALPTQSASFQLPASSSPLSAILASSFQLSALSSQSYSALYCSSFQLLRLDRAYSDRMLPSCKAQASSFRSPASCFANLASSFLASSPLASSHLASSFVFHCSSSLLCQLQPPYTLIPLSSPSRKGVPDLQACISLLYHKGNAIEGV